MVKWSLALRNARLATLEATMGPAIRLQFWAGTEPVSAAAPATGVKVGEIVLASDWMTTPTTGVVGLANLPLAVVGLANGTVSYYRMVSNDGTVCHEQGSITEKDLGGDMIVDNATIKLGQNMQVTVFNKTEPGA